jgi:hypothetical protein
MATIAPDGWPALFTAAFRNSSNAMALLDARRCHVDVNGVVIQRAAAGRPGSHRALPR